ncbi:hypothetical protein UFOVP1261_17 [uncultured Caudovirales phage]|uniref:Uncharacterized protein n=1 Tax=uncultured Caudovirales phage TaxID=2100421 RepID=A0A6J5RIR8_9CAUD|nr:hypothetical protein UFOVP1261_17 [uncultured Caudovirales phage]CAB4221953.1 hypothetical protein UFOVP1650_5 [uncultured Caudovirales phage]
MTHDELLAKLPITTSPEGYTIIKSSMTLGIIKALRAVVELHKPMLSKYMEPDTDRYECQTCREEPYYSFNAPYPCTTIQAIGEQIK